MRPTMVKTKKSVPLRWNYRERKKIAADGENEGKQKSVLQNFLVIIFSVIHREFFFNTGTWPSLARLHLQTHQFEPPTPNWQRKWAKHKPKWQTVSAVHTTDNNLIVLKCYFHLSFYSCSSLYAPLSSHIFFFVALLVVAAPSTIVVCLCTIFHRHFHRLYYCASLLYIFANFSDFMNFFGSTLLARGYWIVLSFRYIAIHCVRVCRDRCILFTVPAIATVVTRVPRWRFCSTCRQTILKILSNIKMFAAKNRSM